jgi:biofilm protein TabA
MYQNQTPLPSSREYRRMILDSVSNLRFYRSVHPLLPLVSEYIHSRDCRELGVGKASIGNGVSVIIDEYKTVSSETRRLECHRKHIDLQMVLRGVEAIGFSTIRQCSSVAAYNDDKDVGFMQGPMDRFTLREDDFVLFFPHDVHMPGLASEKPGGRVKKMVVKLPVV